MENPRPSVPVASDPIENQPLFQAVPTAAELDRQLLAFNSGKAGRGWWAIMGVCSALIVLFLVAVTYTFVRGVGVWGVRIPIAWGYAITNFVWWIGIGHAGTLISAILLLFRAKWRNSVNRFAEAMTLFAVVCAGLFPILHLGRPWRFYWLIPYPSRTFTWPQFRSPLTWDVVAVSTYLTISILFWYVGLLPDLATARDAAKGRLSRALYALASFGWRGSGRHWRHWRLGYWILAALATPLVISVHTVVSFDFAVANLPGWHSTIFPPYFVAGALFSGFGLVLTLLIPARRILHLENVVTEAHLSAMCKITLATGLMVTYGYIQEHFTAWYSGDEVERTTYAHVRQDPTFVIMMVCNVLVPNLFWWRRARTTPWIAWIVSVLVNVGMWTERFSIVVKPLERDWLPSSWAGYEPTWVDVSILLGTLGIFGFGFFGLMKLVPLVPISELKELRHEVEETEAFLRRQREAGAEP